MRTQRALSLGVLLVVLPVLVPAQGIYRPLSFQGMEHSSVRSARTVALGGTSIALSNDASALFSNPAALMQMQIPEVRLGATLYSSATDQIQEWIPNRFYPNLSLLMENLTGGIKPPVVVNPADELQVPYDDLTPNWSSKRSTVRPATISAALPFTLFGDVHCVAAIGFAEATNLDYFYQNNNNLSPNIGDYRPAPMPVLRGVDTLVARWYATTVQRKGAIYGITPAVAIQPLDELSVGLGVSVLTGSSDDTEAWRERGRLVFDAVYRVRNDSVFNRVTSSSASTYSGVVANLGVFYRDTHFSLGAAVQLPATVTRTWDQTVNQDTPGSSTTATRSGSDKLKLPVNYSFGGVLMPSARLRIGVDYVIRELGDAEYSGVDTTFSPWVGSKSLRAGVEYTASEWLLLRVGYREEVASFGGENAGLIGDPVSGSAFTGGVGVRFGGIGVDFAYEYQHLKYQDLWETNVNTNTLSHHALVLETSLNF